jgi:aminopeptidase N
MFWKALNRYLVDNQNRSVVTADLQRAFEQTTNQSLDWFFNQWVYHAGYPELRVRSSYNPATRQLTLNVAQTQAPDATTPEVFRLPVEIEFATASGTRTERIEITQRSQHFNFQLDGRPLMIRFDKGEKILKKLDFPRSIAMLTYQMRNSTDMAGRREAAAQLKRIERRRASQAAAGINLSMLAAISKQHLSR